MNNPLVRKLENYARLSPDEKTSLDRLSSERVRVLEPRTDLFREGDRPRDVNLFLTGWACRYKTLDDGRRQIIAFLLPGDLCDLNVFLLRELDHSIGALTRLTYAEITRETLETITGRYPRITQALWWESLAREATQREWTINLGQRTAYERIAHLLCELYLRQRAVGLNHGLNCPLPITQTDVGDATGLSVVHVNRTLQELRSRELITWKNGELSILDLDALMQAGLFNTNYLHLEHEGQHLDAN
jgi:CRP-like cAMP-binding protein